MSKEKKETMRARLDVLAMALTALARAVPAQRAAEVQESLRRDVAHRLGGVALTPGADAAVAADLGSLMRALGEQASWATDRATLPR